MIERTTPGGKRDKSDKSDWNPAYDGGDCTGLDTRLFFPMLYDDDSPVAVPSVVKQVCGGCEFQVKCLEWAMENDVYGFWAGTSRFQRLQLTRGTSRAKCPGCSSTAIMVMGLGQTCLGCGISWRV